MLPMFVLVGLLGVWKFSDDEPEYMGMTAMTVEDVPDNVVYAFDGRLLMWMYTLSLANMFTQFCE